MINSNEIIQNVNDELSQVQQFKRITEKRLWELEDKKQNRTITRSELFELDMCKDGIKRANKYLKEIGVRK